MTVQGSQAQMQEEQADARPAAPMPPSFQRPGSTGDGYAASPDSSYERILTVEVSEELADALRAEHSRLGNPSPLDFAKFLNVTLLIGLDDMKDRNLEELLSLAEENQAT